MSRLQQLVLYSAHSANILPVTSTCNVNCVFCSHRQNPPGLEVFRISPRSIEEIKDTLCYLDSGRKIVIGESVTRIIEGEPFTHPDFMTILQTIRARFADTPIQITTNGTLLDAENVAIMARLALLEINLSLNSSSICNRQKLMRDANPELAINSVNLLDQHKIPFHGSIVAMPHLTGWGDLEDTIRFLDQGGARTIRVFMPGFTKLAGAEVRFDPQLGSQLASFVAELRSTIATPVVFEPSALSNLDAEIEGIIQDSPVHQAGLEIGDIIVTVNGNEVFSRVDAFRQVFYAEDPVLLIQRKSTLREKNLVKAAGFASGLVMLYDLDPVFAEQVPLQIKRIGALRVLFLTSLLAGPILNAGLKKLDLKVRFEVLPVASIFFGGTIMTAGLLLVSDFAVALEEFLKSNTRPDLVILPEIAFDHLGKDLTGRSYLEIADKFGVAVVLN